MLCSILLAYDDKATLELLSEYLALEDFKIVGCATNGLEAVNLYKQFKPNIVIMGDSMPNYDGVYGLEHIKKFNPYAKVIIITQKDDQSIRKKIIELEATSIVKIPIAIDKLVDIVKFLMPLK